MRSLDLKVKMCKMGKKTIPLKSLPPIGALTGFIFYWAFILGLFSSKSAVINPMSDFALSVVGGWVGTNVFTLLLK